MVKKRLVAVVLSLAMISVGNFSYAHSGGHNSSGGHHNKNKSELTRYYCGGHSAHQPNKGFCPYASTKENSGVTISSVHNEKNHKNYFAEKGYNKGYEDGCKGLYNLSVTEAKFDNLYEKEILKSSYEKGYLIGYNEYKAKKVDDVMKKMLDIPMLASI
ncbi:TPA: hypothetical protein KN238_002937 [Clostridioides difficile]|nr:hypothetical protein [Clostridioides difficile]MDU8845151.1 hypothetical protein [Clostridioides difficile]HBF2808266.1 hypothetical protein [Clostridioides difficile]HBF3758327.1 hypothetical protein [Clostridioides difficile]HBF6246572.1 hypothetical protein [Clostridioides difficile]